MPDKEVDVSLKTQLEEAERKGYKQGLKKGLKEGHNKGMTDLLAVFSAADDGFIPDYSGSATSRDDCSWQLRARIDAALLNAASQSDRELVHFLVKAGADVDAYNKEHRTALQCAVKEGNIKMAKALIKAGASAYRRGEWKIYCDYVSPLECALEQGHIKMVKVLLAAGALQEDGDKAGDDGWLINYEAEDDPVELTRIFIKAGAYLGPYKYDNFWTPLTLAICWGKTKSAALLIEAGCDVNSGDTTALMVAAEGKEDGDIDTTRLLLNAGAEVNRKDRDGCTALICAAKYDSPKTVRLLLSAGADVFSRAEFPATTRYYPGRIQMMNAFDVAKDEAVKEIIKREMHRRIASALSVLPLMPVDVRQKIIQLYTEELDTDTNSDDSE